MNHKFPTPQISLWNSLTSSPVNASHPPSSVSISTVILPCSLKTFKKKFQFALCIWALCPSVHYLSTQGLRRPEEGVEYHGRGVNRWLWIACGCRESNSGHAEDQSVLLTAEPAFTVSWDRRDKQASEAYLYHCTHLLKSGCKETKDNLSCYYSFPSTFIAFYCHC